MSTQFFRQPSDVWVISSQIPRRRRDQLQNAPDFPDIVDMFTKSILRVSVHRERCKKTPTHHRVWAALTLSDTKSVDFFHNASSGYRAQYLHAPELGELSNRLTVNALFPLLSDCLSEGQHRRWDVQWAHASLLGHDAKVWIHQGPWLRYARSDCEELMVPAWVARSRDLAESVQMRVRYGRQLPGSTNAIEVKGAWVNGDCEFLSGPPKLFSARSLCIHHDGFT